MHHRKEPTIRILRINQVVCELGILSINCRQVVKEFHHIRRIHHIRNLLLFLKVGWPFKKGDLQHFVLKLGYHFFSTLCANDLAESVKGIFFHFRLEGISFNVFTNKRSRRKFEKSFYKSYKLLCRDTVNNQGKV